MVLVRSAVLVSVCRTSPFSTFNGKRRYTVMWGPYPMYRLGLSQNGYESHSQLCIICITCMRALHLCIACALCVNAWCAEYVMCVHDECMQRTAVVNIVATGLPVAVCPLAVLMLPGRGNIYTPLARHVYLYTELAH